MTAAWAAAHADDGFGSLLEATVPDPWPEEVDGAALLDETRRALGELVVMAPEACTATALWVGFTYIFEVAPCVPRLLVKSPTQRCGKTKLLEALAELVNRPLPVSNSSAAALFRTIAKIMPTLLLDEADTYVRNNDEIRGLINSGHRRQMAYVLRVEDINNRREVRRFSTFAPMVVAGIGDQHGTIEDRSIITSLRR